MAIKAKHGVLVIDVLILAPDVPAAMELLWDNNYSKYLKKHWAEISIYYKRKVINKKHRNLHLCSSI